MLVTGWFGKAYLWGLKSSWSSQHSYSFLKAPPGFPLLAPRRGSTPGVNPRHSGDFNSFYVLFVSCKGVGGEVGWG